MVKLPVAFLGTVRKMYLKTNQEINFLRYFLGHEISVKYPSCFYFDFWHHFVFSVLLSSLYTPSDKTIHYC